MTQNGEHISAHEIPAGMPGPDATDGEFVQFFVQKLSIMEEGKDREFYLYLADELLPKLKDESAREALIRALAKTRPQEEDVAA